MCFSAEASFTSAAALLPVGGYCALRAARNDPRFLPVALVPIAFGLQQLAEGCVWLGLEGGDAVLLTPASVAFLFFALAFWPFWIPFCLAFPEERAPARRVLVAAALLSLVYLALFAPLALDPGRWLAVEVRHHSVAYEFSGLPGFQVVPRTGWRVAYLGFIVGPLLIARPAGDGGSPYRALVGVLVAALFAACYLLYWYAFTSVWCFFAALLSLLLAAGFARLPARTRPGRGGPAAVRLSESSPILPRL